MKTSRDIALLQNVIDAYSIFGFSPFICRKSKISMLLSAMIPFIMFIFVVTNLIFFLMDVYCNSSLRPILEIGKACALAAFLLTCFFSFFTHRGLWRDLLYDIENFDTTMEEYKIEVNKNSILFCMKILLISTIYLLVLGTLFWTYEREKYIQWMIHFTYASFDLIQIHSITIIFEELLKILADRYDFLESIIEDVHKSPRCAKLFWSKYQLRTMHFLLSDVVEKINTLFGLKIMGIFTYVFFYTLVVFHFVFLDEGTTGKKDILHIIVVFLYSAILFVSM